MVFIFLVKAIRMGNTSFVFARKTLRFFFSFAKILFENKEGRKKLLGSLFLFFDR